MTASAKRQEGAVRRPRLDGVEFDDLSTGAQLREIALGLFADHGIQATSIRMVAAAAGVSPGAILHYYPSKKALESAVREEVLRRVFHRAQAVSPSDAPLEALANRFRAYAEVVQSQPALARYMRRVFIEGGEESVELFRTLVEALGAEHSARVAAGRAREFEDPEVGIALYFHLVSAQVLIGPLLEAVVGLNLEDPEDVARLNRALMDLLSRALFSQ
ncbi:TetR/AcrR family transcriptional regulator [Pseudofrankia inefficax]|uniref:Regulatory protein TetR n=1 Tax=Pseudofrankia inefficax (strain DSM 45817 / CECT 9037 / DDB 130130 / EuI1c) TaxID=298654 RepID=E3J2Q8_PSEI1|nr:TetR family transcriptional regulator [Pseudofrankia inefficax]ADP81719.1 regulatory protein TetR [Pseudofrankia inefficax]